MEARATVQARLLALGACFLRFCSSKQVARARVAAVVYILLCTVFARAAKSAFCCGVLPLAGDVLSVMVCLQEQVACRSRRIALRTYCVIAFVFALPLTVILF